MGLGSRVVAIVSLPAKQHLQLTANLQQQQLAKLVSYFPCGIHA